MSDMTTKDALVSALRAAEAMWTKAGGEIDESCAVAGSAMALAINNFLAEYDATNAGGKWVGEEFFPNKPETAQGEVVAYLHTVVQDDGHEDSALSFSADSFPFEDVGGFKSIAVQKLYASPPTRAPGIDDAIKVRSHYQDDLDTFMHSQVKTADDCMLASLIDAGVRVENRK